MVTSTYFAKYRLWPAFLFMLASIFFMQPTPGLAASCEPLSTLVGDVVTVETDTELQAAVNQANNSGGNMTILLDIA